MKENDQINWDQYIDAYRESGLSLKIWCEYSANRSPLDTVEKSTPYSRNIRFIKNSNTLKSPSHN